MPKPYAVALLAALLSALPAAAAEPPRKNAPAPPGPARALTAEEREACAADLEAVENRARLFEGQGLAPAEIARRNEGARAAVAECLRGHRLARAAQAARDADVAELERRAGPEATDEVRTQIWTQLRLERLSAKPVSELTDDEKEELRAGNKAELAETHATLDTAHARDPIFMRMVHSALACYHGVRRDRLRDALRREEALLAKNQGERQRAYALKSEIRQSDDVLARAREAARTYKGGLGRCTEEKVAVLARCLASRFDAQEQEPACESEEIQQYIRFIK